MKKFFKQKNTGHQILNSSKGFTLVETLVAISIFTVSLLGIMSVLASGISNTSYAKQKMVATYLAQEGIEYMRNMRDTHVLYDAASGQAGWDIFKNKLDSFPCDVDHKCGFDFDDSTPPGPLSHIFLCSGNNCELSGSYAGFARKIWADTSVTDKVEIFSEVSWTQGSGPHSVTFSESLFNWLQ